MRNKNVLTLVFKVLKHISCLISRGSDLKSLGAATANALSRSVFLVNVLPLYGSSSISLFRRSKYLLGHKLLTKLLMQLGDRPLIALKTKINILNCTLCFMGSQTEWRERSTGLMPVRKLCCTSYKPGCCVLNSLKFV